MTVKQKLRIAHISDLHFARLTFSPTQFFSKRWLGNLNLAFSRRRIHAPSRLYLLSDLFQQMGIDYILISGDLSTTSKKKEFADAQKFIDHLELRGCRVIAIPGNHDHYTRRAWKSRLFYRYFPSYHQFGLSLEQENIAMIPLNDEWTVIALDTAQSTSLFSSCGYFTEQLEESLSRALSSVSPKKQVIILNHFPLFSHESPRKILQGADSLRRLLSCYPNVRFYLHGHTHRHCLADLRASQLPIVLDSGSTSLREQGSWNLLDLHSRGADVECFQYTNAADPTKTQAWEPFAKQSFSW